MTRTNKWSQWQADSMIALVAMSWGSAYLLMKIGLDGIPPCSIIALRFGIAFLAVGGTVSKCKMQIETAHEIMMAMTARLAPRMTLSPDMPLTSLAGRSMPQASITMKVRSLA